MWDFRAYRGLQGRSGCGNLAENAANFSLFRSSMSMNFWVQAEASACLEPRLAVRLGGVEIRIFTLLYRRSGHVPSRCEAYYQDGFPY